MITLLQKILMRLFLNKKTFAGSPSEIIMQLQKWQEERNVYLIESFYTRNPYKKSQSFETYYYVEANGLMRWFGLNQYTYKRNYNNVFRAKHQRATN